MALFVDGPACTIDDLTDQDAGLLGVAQTTGINVYAKLRLAQEEIGTDLQLWLIRPRSMETFVGTCDEARAGRGDPVLEALGDDARSGACLPGRLFQRSWWIVIRPSGRSSRSLRRRPARA